MKFKFVFILLIGCLLSTIASAQTLSANQKQFRLDVYEILKDKQYKIGNFDYDGDIPFTVNNNTYYFHINSNHEKPYVISIVCYITYNRDESRQLMKGIQSIAGHQFKGVKLFLDSIKYQLRYDFVCNDTKLFKNTIESIIKEIDKMDVFIKEMRNNNLLGENFNDNEALFLKACNMYKQDDESKRSIAFRLLSYLDSRDYNGTARHLGICYENGYGIDPDQEKMEYYYNKAIKEGDIECAYWLGCNQMDNHKYNEAYQNLLKCATSDNNNRCDALYRIGFMQENGNGTDKDLKAAVNSYRKALDYSTQLECDARLALIRLKEEAERRDEFKDATKSMLMGLTPNQMYKKGIEYEQGTNNRLVSLPKAYAYIKAAADEKYPEAYSKMGEIYISEYYPFHDVNESNKYYKKAFKLLEKKANSSNAACYEIAKMYEFGRYVEKDEEKAKEYYKLAADKGYADAAYRMGLYLKSNLDYVDARAYFLKAAEKQHGDAMYELAKMYQYGHGGAENINDAKKWYLECSKNTENRFQKAANNAKKELKKLKTL